MWELCSCWYKHKLGRIVNGAKHLLPNISTLEELFQSHLLYFTSLTWSKGRIGAAAHTWTYRRTYVTQCKTVRWDKHSHWYWGKCGHFLGYSGYQPHRSNGVAFLTALSRSFPKEEVPPPRGSKPVGIVRALNLLNAECQTRKQLVPFLCLWWWNFDQTWYMYV